jgi:D-beta-D-heptose 7-phosphate kinase/D-beta-D-heptose 1-phosphate adenosyltransferase
VDLALIFDEDTPLALIAAVGPGVLVKGADWAEDAIVGADFVRARGGKVRSLPYVKGASSRR